MKTNFLHSTSFFADFAGLRIVTSVVQGVFQVREDQQYAFNYYDAERLCEIFQATLATPDQLYAAWEAGLQQCAYVAFINITGRICCTYWSQILTKSYSKNPRVRT